MHFLIHSVPTRCATKIKKGIEGRNRQGGVREVPECEEKVMERSVLVGRVLRGHGRDAR